MGARGQVRVINKETGHDVYLYTHWGVDRMANDVVLGLSRGKSRWNDEEYLTRIIFDAMKKDDTDSEIGFGIGNSEHGDIELLITIDVGNQQVKVGKTVYSFREYTGL